MIHFFKECIKLYPGWKGYQFNFSPTENYQTINQFYAEVETGGYKIDFDNIKQTYIDQAVAEGKLYLFKIYNKDFSSYSKGTPNLHTLFWCHVFSPENLSDPVIKLNGEAEIFFRRHSIKDTKTTHPANQPLQNKNPLNKKQTSTFAYPLIKDKRYREDQFYFHVPLTLNRSPINNDLRNDQVNAFLKNNPDINIIGIDRGERHLLYLTVIDQQGKIIEQRSLNQISNKGEAPHDYQQKLDQREKQRAKARESWGTVENIKELKAGYLSLIVHEISKLVIEYNAIICLENLNFGFKRGRFKVEKQVYQKFEKALIDKLNYLCFKSQPLNESGSILKAYQLSSKFDSFEKLGLQTGIIFYVNPSYTSKIDPATGFVNLLGKQIRYQNVEQAKQLISNLNNFQFNLKPNHFEITLDYQKLKSNWKNKNYQSCWTICTHDERLVSTKTNNTWNTESIDITLQLKQLFDQYQIDYHNQTNLIESMLEITNSGFFKRLLWLLQITTSLRYSQPNDTEDFILSPVADKHGNFFDSRKSGTFLPQNGDANGAYHIALKGLWNLRQINNTPVDSNGFLKAKLTLSNDEWFNFVQTQPYRNSP